MNALTTLYYAFCYGYSLRSVTLPTSMNALTTLSYAFCYCYSLRSVTLPASLSLVTDVSLMLDGCYVLNSVANLATLGRTGAAVDGTNFLYQTEMMTGTITLGAFFSKLDIYGQAGKLNLITGIRLTNAASTFGGASPQIQVSYNSMNAAALNLLFGDLPTLGAKTIDITGNPGAATCDKTIATLKGWTVIG
jgi:hypothetical protein